MILAPYLNKTVVVKRRVGGASGTGAPVDAYNAPNYGEVSTWPTAYATMPCRIETMTAPIQFKESGERVLPTPKMYIIPPYALQVEDRIIDGSTTYIVQGVIPKWDQIGGINHYEIDLLIEP